MSNSVLPPDEPQWRYKEIKASKPSETLTEGTVSENVPSTHSRPTLTADSNTSMNKIHGNVLIGLGCIVTILVGWTVFKPAPKFAYKVINVQAQFSKAGQAVASATSDTSAKLNSTNVNLSEEDLSILGKEGWELVDTILETETTHPNFGSTDYVTGLQPNIRPQRAVLLFKRKL